MRQPEKPKSYAILGALIGVVIGFILGLIINNFGSVFFLGLLGALIGSFKTRK